MQKKPSGPLNSAISSVTVNDDATLTITASAFVPSTGYTFALEQKKDGDLFVLRARLNRPQGATSPKMDNETFEETIAIPAGVKTIMLMHPFVQAAVLEIIPL